MDTSLRHHRVLVTGMQSSGSSLFSYFVAQVPNSLAVIDLWIRQPAPSLVHDLPVSLKTCIADVRAFGQDVSTFRPTLTVLCIRNPVDIYRSLRTKWYFHDGGQFAWKCQAFEALFADRAELFDLVVRYEDFTTAPEATAAILRKAGLALPPDALRFSRSLDEIRRFACGHDPWCRANVGLRWTDANIHADKLERLGPITYGSPDAEAAELMWRLCPQVMDHYANATSEVDALRG